MFASQPLMFAFVFVFAAIALVTAVVFFIYYSRQKAEPSKRSIRMFGLFTLIGAVLSLVTPILYFYNSNSLLKGVKKPTTAIGVYITLLVSVIALVYGVSVLYRNKSLSAFDFMILPGLVYLIINNYIPMSGIVIAFKKIDYSMGVFSSPWVGFDNFKFLFASNDAFNIIRNTVLYNVAFIITTNIAGILVGYFLAECVNKLIRKASQTLILLPQLISAVIIAYIVYGFLSKDSGWINKTILGDANSIQFYAEPKYWPFILTIVNLWKGLGYSALIYLASILSIDRNLYEAAYMDGCGKFKQFTKITLPQLAPTVIILLIMSVGRIMGSDFGLFYQATMNSGALYSVTQTLDVYVYRAIMETNNLSMGAAAGAFQSVVGFVLVLVTNGIVRKLDKNSAMF